MNRNALVALTALLAFLIGAALLVSRSRRPSTLEETPLSNVSISDISRLDVVILGSTTTVTSVGGAWRLNAPINDRADREAVERMISIFPSVRFGSVLSENVDRHDRYMVNDASATIVRVYVRGQESPAATWLMGKETADLESVFVRLPGRPEVRTAEGLPRHVLFQTFHALRSPDLLPVAPAQLDSFAIAAKGVDLKFSRSSETWTNAETRQMVGGAAMADLHAAMSALRAVSITERSAEIDQALSKPYVTLSVQAAGQTSVVTVGGMAKSGDSDVRYATVSDRPSVFAIPASTADAVIVKAKALQP